MEQNYEILEDFGVIEESRHGWEKHLVLISWHGNRPAYEIRSFFEGKPGKLTKVTPEGMKKLMEMMQRIEF